MKFDVEIIRALDKVYFLNFKDQYDLSMCFLRYQEYYESPNPDFYRTSFMILDFIEWYTKKYDSESTRFKYAYDWAGFNIPSFVFDDLEMNIKDFNKYDDFMFNIRNDIRTQLKNEKKSEDFYLIGSVGINTSTFNHELAHGMYYTNSDYKSKVAELLGNIPNKVLEGARNSVRAMMYNESVIDDEVQAYMSTGLLDSMNKVRGIKTQCKPFKKNFESFKELLKVK